MAVILNPYFERLIAKYLKFYTDLHEGRRRPKTAAQRQFQGVAWGEDDPVTDHERAYIYYLEKIGKSPKRNTSLLPRNIQPLPNSIWKKWDDAADNMKKWKPWRD